MPLAVDSNKLIERMKKKMIDDQIDNMTLRILVEDKNRENHILQEQVSQLYSQIQELSAHYSAQFPDVPVTEDEQRLPIPPERE